MSEKPFNKSIIALISIFFFWGFVAASNTILIPLFKKHFVLLQWQSQLVDFAFYAAYFSGSLLYFILSITIGDPLNKTGYKKGLIYGLILSAVGALGFVPAASLSSFPLMLTSLFVLALGFALQQIVAYPYIIALGEASTGAHRINLAGGINSFGTTIGPLLVSYAIFGNIDSQTTGINGLETVKIPYVCLSVAFLVFAFILMRSNLPLLKSTEPEERSLRSFQYPQLTWGMLAIFLYVGVEVSIQSNLPELMRQSYILGKEPGETVHFISMYWGSLMIGRWTGALSAFNLSKNKARLFTVFVPILAFAVIMLVNYIKGCPMEDFLYYFPFIILLIVGFFIVGKRPAVGLILFGSLGVLLILIGLISTGKLALYSFLSGGLFCSVMWPYIFSLSLAGLGNYTNQGSSLLIMMILGGAIIPPLQGFLADKTSIHFSYFIPALCFAYLAFYGWKVKRILKSQHIDYDNSTGSGH